jgi:hypothetical protein
MRLLSHCNPDSKGYRDGVRLIDTSHHDLLDRSSYIYSPMGESLPMRAPAAHAVASRRQAQEQPQVLGHRFEEVYL